jgi:hypothetical protein
MTFVGKVLVVVQVVLSLCFMAFAGAVYTVQEDWKEAHEKKVADLATKNKEIEEKNQQIAFLNKDLAATQAIQTDLGAYLAQIGEQELAQNADNEGIRTQLRNLATRLQQAEAEVGRLEKEKEDINRNWMLAKQNYEELETENKKVVDEAKERQQEAELFKQQNKDLNAKVAQLNDIVFNLEDQIFSGEADAKTAAEKQKSLLVQVAFLKDVIRREGIDEKVAMNKAEPPPLVYGRVINTKAASRSNPEYVEISLGSDDGLSEGHKLSVYRNQGRGQYMGEILLVHVAADRAVGEVLLKSKNGIIQRGDNVTTKL